MAGEENPSSRKNIATWVNAASAIVIVTACLGVWGATLKTTHGLRDDLREYGKKVQANHDKLTRVEVQLEESRKDIATLSTVVRDVDSRLRSLENGR